MRQTPLVSTGLLGTPGPTGRHADDSPADQCGYTCACHGNIVCTRASHDHDPDADMGAHRPRGNVVPHVGPDQDGTLVQWVCLPRTADDIAFAEQLAAAERAEAERRRADRAELVTEMIAAVADHKARTGKLPWD